MWKDVVTPMGLPIVTLDETSFDQVAQMVASNLDISKAWPVDAASCTATELGGAVIGSLAAALGWAQAEAERFASCAASRGMSGTTSGNPVLLVVSLAVLAHAYQQALDQGTSGLGAVADGLARGGLGTGALVGLSALIGGPAWGGLMVGIVGSMAAQRLYDATKDALSTDAASTRRQEILAFLMRQIGGSLSYEARPTAPEAA